MQKPRYALVAYLNNPAGEFVENLRRELHPELPHLAAHLSILPPRPLLGSESSALQMIQRICSHEQPFDVILGEVETFAPVTPTVYIRVAAAERMSELHARLNTEDLAFKEEWAYTPHLTIVKMGAEQPARTAFQLARERWAEYSGSRGVRLDKLMFVREQTREEARDRAPDGLPNCWTDLAPVLLGGSLNHS